MSYFYLEITRGIDKGRLYPLPDGAISIGRSSQNSIIMNSLEKSVSGHHAIIYKSPERIMAQDLQSTNGTYCNEIKVTEKELALGDTLGFGKAGPRLKLVVSDSPLDTSSDDRSAGTPAPRTTDDTASAFANQISKDPLQHGYEPRHLNLSPLLESDDAMGPRDLSGADPSHTMEIKQKLVDKNLDADGMRKLMKDEERFERVLDSAKLGSTQTKMLRTMFDANRGNRKKWLWILVGVISVSAIVVSVLGVRAYQYRQVINKAQTLKNDIAEYDKRIARANDNPEENKRDLQRMIAELEEKEKSFSSLQSKIADDDFGKFYSDPIEKKIDELLARFGETDYHIPSQMVERIKYHIGVYSGVLRNVVGHYIVRKDKYFPMIQQTFKSKNLPVELAYVSMLESGFNPEALSSAGARGLWQFMPATGRRYGLAVDGAVDERTDPVKATAAAAEYFKDLISIFGGKSSVMLCMAAYNAGEGRIMGALQKIDDPIRNRDFWYIYRMGYLAEETNEYIPRVIALIIISEDPTAYRFPAKPSVNPAEIESAKDFVEVKSTR